MLKINDRGSETMGKYQGLAEKIVSSVGGKKNIQHVTHCMTRLRFTLKDEQIVEENVLKNMEGIITVIKSGGQFQVVIGNHVSHVFEEITPIIGESNGDKQAATSNGNVFNRLIDILSGCFQPFLGVLGAAGMILGLNALLAFFGTQVETFHYGESSGTYVMLYAIGNAIFFFMPIIVGYTSAIKFNLNPMVGIVIGAVLCYPDVQADSLQEAFGAVSFSIFGTEAYTTFMGIPWVGGSYTSSVAPVIFIVAFAAQIQKFAKRLIPEIVQTFLVPFAVLLLSLPIGFLVIGPIISLLIDLLGVVFQVIMNISPAIYGLLLGFFWQVMVMFGLHWSLIPLEIMNITQFGESQILSSVLPGSFAQTAVIIAMYFKLKDRKLKTLAVPAIISGFFGVTEPAIYGLSLPKKRPFIFSMVGAAIGGMIIAMLHGTSYRMGGLGVFSFVSFISPDGDLRSMNIGLAATATAIIISFSLTFFFWKDRDESSEQETKKNRSKEIIHSPLEGTIAPLSSSRDSAFAQGLLGEGILLYPTADCVSAPFDGTVSVVFPTKHAVGLISTSGIELLIHIGINTVDLNGKFFEVKVQQGQEVKQGDILVTFEREAILAAGYQIETPIIITNSHDYSEIIVSDEEILTTADKLMTIRI